MFNESQKSAFLKQYISRMYLVRTAIAAFEVFAPYENAWGADLCTKSAEELQAPFNEVFSSRTKGRYVSVMLLREYTRWCMEQGFNGACDGMLQVQIPGLEEVRYRYESDPADLHACLNLFLKDEAAEMSDLITRGFCWTCYSGIPVDGVLDLTTDCVDFSEMKIWFRGQSFPMYRESLLTFMQLVRLQDFRFFYMGHYIRRKRTGGNMLFRGIRELKEPKQLVARLRQEVVAVNKEREVDRTIAPQWISDSGMFYRAYQDELRGIPATFTDWVTAESAGREYVLDQFESKEQRLKKIERWKYEKYIEWKLAFNLV